MSLQVQRSMIIFLFEEIVNFSKFVRFCKICKISPVVERRGKATFQWCSFLRVHANEIYEKKN